MNENKEECPVCWRPFAANLIPMIITCGHSFCKDCCTGIKSCPLCRKKTAFGSVPMTNYALISLLDKNISMSNRERKTQECQTDDGVQSDIDGFNESNTNKVKNKEEREEFRVKLTRYMSGIMQEFNVIIN